VAAEPAQAQLRVYPDVFLLFVPFEISKRMRTAAGASPDSVI
jgi:hypothetical protein